MLHALQNEFPKARCTGVEYSEHLCSKNGWIRGSVIDYAARTPYDLVVCHDVLPSLDDTTAARRSRIWRRLCRGALYLGVLAAEDWDHCDRARTDPDVFLRPAKWYRRQLDEELPEHRRRRVRAKAAARSRCGRSSAPECPPTRIEDQSPMRFRLSSGLRSISLLYGSMPTRAGRLIDDELERRSGGIEAAFLDDERRRQIVIAEVVRRAPNTPTSSHTSSGTSVSRPPPSASNCRVATVNRHPISPIVGRRDAARR